MGPCTIQLVSFAGVFVSFLFFFRFSPPFLSPLFCSCYSGYLLWRVFVSCFSLLGVSFYWSIFLAFTSVCFRRSFLFHDYHIFYSKKKPTGMCTREACARVASDVAGRPLGGRWLGGRVSVIYFFREFSGCFSSQ